jgi:hypothetical protein
MEEAGWIRDALDLCSEVLGSNIYQAMDGAGITQPV